jgi:hypothetical protein
MLLTVLKSILQDFMANYKGETICCQLKKNCLITW